MTNAFSKKIYLASTSPRRRELLASLGILFEVIPPDYEERPTSLPAPEEALLFAEKKARSVEKRCPGSLILASDTLIECARAKLGKPADPADAERILKQLSGRTHAVYTAVVLLDTTDGSLRKHVERTDVTFRSLSDEAVVNYIATGEPFGKAGAYAVQGKARTFIAKVEGDEESVIGLPLGPIRKWLDIL